MSVRRVRGFLGKTAQACVSCRKSYEKGSGTNECRWKHEYCRMRSIILGQIGKRDPQRPLRLRIPPTILPRVWMIAIHFSLRQAFQQRQIHLPIPALRRNDDWPQLMYIPAERDCRVMRECRVGDDDGERDVGLELENLRRFVEEKVGEMGSEKRFRIVWVESRSNHRFEAGNVEIRDFGVEEDRSVEAACHDYLFREQDRGRRQSESSAS